MLNIRRGEMLSQWVRNLPGVARSLGSEPISVRVSLNILKLGRDLFLGGFGLLQFHGWVWYYVCTSVQPPWPFVNTRTWRHRTSGASCVKYSAPPFTAQARRPSNTGQIHKKRARLNFPTSYQLRHVPATFQDAILKSPTQFHSVAPQSVQALFFWKDRIHLSNSTYQITKPLPLHPHHFLDWAFFHPPCFWRWRVNALVSHKIELSEIHSSGNYSTNHPK